MIRTIKYYLRKLQKKSPIRKAKIRRNRIERIIDWARMLKINETNRNNH